MAEETKITQENFGEYFFDVRKNRPKQGQIMAKYAAVAEFVDGPEKRDIIRLIQMDKAYQAAQVMKKIHLAKEPDCYRVLREMCQDLIDGMTEEEVEKKPYEFVLEAFFYTNREYVPKNDPKWETIDLIEYDDETKTFKSTINISLPEKTEETA